MGNKRPRSGRRVVAARANSQNAVGWLDHITDAGYQERVLGTDHQHHGLESTQGPVGPPFFCQLGRSTRNIARMIFEPTLESLEKGKRIGTASRKSGDHPTVEQPADFHGVRLHDRVPERDLTVAAEGYEALMANRENRRGVELHGRLKTGFLKVNSYFLRISGMLPGATALAGGPNITKSVCYTPCPLHAVLC